MISELALLVIIMVPTWFIRCYWFVLIVLVSRKIFGSPVAECGSFCARVGPGRDLGPSGFFWKCLFQSWSVCIGHWYRCGRYGVTDGRPVLAQWIYILVVYGRIEYNRRLRCWSYGCLRKLWVIGVFLFLGGRLGRLTGFSGASLVFAGTGFGT